MSRCTQSLPATNGSRAKDPLKVPKEVGRLQETLQERFLMIFESNVVSNKETMMERTCQCRNPEILSYIVDEHQRLLLGMQGACGISGCLSFGSVYGSCL